MRAIQRINHNAAVCVDAAGRQLIALGKGIGFAEMPHEVALDDIQRTFYGIDPKYLGFINEVDPEVLEFSAQLADIISQQVSYELSPNLPVTLADHIQFAIKRANDHMVIPMNLGEDIEQLHPVEFRFAQMAVNGIKKTFNVRMPKDEVAGIALSVINAAVKPSERAELEGKREDRLLKRTLEQIESDMNVTVDKDSFIYARFVTHVRYLIERAVKGELIDSNNVDLYDTLVKQYPQAAACALEIARIFQDELGDPLEQEEIVYLIMHVTRLASKSGSSS